MVLLHTVTLPIKSVFKQNEEEVHAMMVDVDNQHSCQDICKRQESSCFWCAQQPDDDDVVDSSHSPVLMTWSRMTTVSAIVACVIFLLLVKMMTLLTRI